LELLKALAERGHNTTLVASTSRSTFQIGDPRIKIIAIPIRRAPIISRIVYSVILFFLLPIHIIVDKPDFVVMDPEMYVISSIPTLLISRARLLRTKFVLDIKSKPVEVKSFRGRLFEFCFNVSILEAKQLFQGMTVITSLMKSELCNKFHIDQSKVGVWTSGVPIGLFNPRNSFEESMKLRKELGLTEKFIVFYHGVFTASRGLAPALDALRIVNQKYPNVVCFLLGTGPAVSDLEKLIQQKNLQHNVIIHNPVSYEDVPKFIGLSNLCIIPLPNNSYWTFQSPMKLLEYLAMEKVVLATDIPAHRVIMGNEKCCIYLRSVDPIEIAKSIEYAYVNEDKLNNWGKVGRKIVEDKYTWNKVAEEVEHYLLSIS
jgi:glycosyltransferase involved in cell wall biosynthesis